MPIATRVDLSTPDAYSPESLSSLPRLTRAGLGAVAGNCAAEAIANFGRKAGAIANFGRKRAGALANFGYLAGPQSRACEKLTRGFTLGRTTAQRYATLNTLGVRRSCRKDTLYALTKVVVVLFRVRVRNLLAFDPDIHYALFRSQYRLSQLVAQWQILRDRTPPLLRGRLF